MATKTFDYDININPKVNKNAQAELQKLFANFGKLGANGDMLKFELDPNIKNIDQVKAALQKLIDNINNQLKSGINADELVNNLLTSFDKVDITKSIKKQIDDLNSQFSQLSQYTKVFDGSFSGSISSYLKNYTTNLEAASNQAKELVNSLTSMDNASIKDYDAVLNTISEQYKELSKVRFTALEDQVSDSKLQKIKDLRIEYKQLIDTLKQAQADRLGALEIGSGTSPTSTGASISAVANATASAAKEISSSAEGIKAETEAINELAHKLSEDVPNAITIKNNAFKDEQTIVEQTVQAEVTALNNLVEKINEIKANATNLMGNGTETVIKPTVDVESLKTAIEGIPKELAMKFTFPNGAELAREVQESALDKRIVRRLKVPIGVRFTVGSGESAQTATGKALAAQLQSLIETAKGSIKPVTIPVKPEEGGLQEFTEEIDKSLNGRRYATIDTLMKKIGELKQELTPLPSEVANNVVNAVSQIAPVKKELQDIVAAIQTIKNTKVNIDLQAGSTNKGGKYDNGLSAVEKKLNSYQSSSAYGSALSASNNSSALAQSINEFRTLINEVHNLDQATADQVETFQQRFAVIQGNIQAETALVKDQQNEYQKLADALIKVRESQAYNNKDANGVSEQYAQSKEFIAYKKEIQSLAKEIAASTDAPREKIIELQERLDTASKNISAAYKQMAKDAEDAAKKSSTGVNKIIAAYQKLQQSQQYTGNYTDNPNSPGSLQQLLQARTDIQNKIAELQTKVNSGHIFDPAELEAETQRINALKDALVNAAEGAIPETYKGAKQLMEALQFNQGSETIDKIKQATAALEQFYGGTANWSSQTSSTNANVTTLTGTFKEQDGIIRTVTVDLNTMTGAMYETGQATQQAKTFGEKFSEAFSRKGMNFLAWLTTQFSMQRLVAEFRKGIEIVREFDTAMVEIQRVTKDTQEAVEQFRGSVFSIADAVGSTGQDIAKSAGDWSRLGYSMAEAAELAKNTAIYNQVGFLNNIDTATEHLVSTLKAFNIDANESLGVIDALDSVGNHFAISSGEIGEGLKRSASALEAANNTFAESVALITATNETLQDPAKVGNSLRTIALRIRGKMLPTYNENYSLCYA